MTSSNKFQIVIGLEVHVQLATASKLFCADETHFGGEPNTRISEVSLAYPGTLPVLNRKAVDLAIKAGIAANSKIASVMHFDRKNYFYPDLPKGYQITQDQSPICSGGFIPIRTKDNERIDIALTKIHLEEDAGKSIHDISNTHSLIDFNRAGMPLIEIVTEPVISSIEDAASFLYETRRMIRYLKIGDGNMEEGSLRCDVNISIKEPADTELGSKVEIKNLNSIKNVQKALKIEIERQSRLANSGEHIVSETRLFDVSKGVTSSMRKKETLTDYRYFPDPDLPIVEIPLEWVETVRKSIDYIPWDLEDKIVAELGLSSYDAGVITGERGLAIYFLALGKYCGNYKAASNWVMGPIKSYINTNSCGISDFPISGRSVGDMINKIGAGLITFNTASKVLFPSMLESPNLSVEEHITQLGLVNENHDDELALWVDETIAKYPKEFELLKRGKKKLMGMFMGEIMRKSKGKADPNLARELLMNKIG